MLDRFEQHTQVCSSCKGAYNGFQIVKKFLVGTTVLLAATAGVPSDVQIRLVLAGLALISAASAYALHEKEKNFVFRDYLAPFDLTKQKKKTFVVQDAIEDSAESHGRHIIRCLIFIYGSQEVKEEEVFDIFCLPELFFHSLNLDFEDYVPHILFILMVVRGYIAEHPNDEEEVEGIDLHQQRYPWEGSDMVYLYDEVSISLDGLRSIFESRRFEITKLAMCQDSKSISADEHPNDEEEVEGIDLHQQRYPWEGSDMDYLYDESSFAQLLSMKLTLEIDGAIFHVPNANASSNVDSQL
ncbi:hypothetical protein F2Q70_00024463 [Brassica cretica]|uniref:Uncharacterized protein n=1 Tax=Brassica cretica TaxID=69181 RepID=A0A8S9LEG4_BRACR|nr:hypothetical protein F2Q70_00024463 [Brassica cretica]